MPDKGSSTSNTNKVPTVYWIITIHFDSGFSPITIFNSKCQTISAAKISAFFNASRMLLNNKSSIQRVIPQKTVHLFSSLSYAIFSYQRKWATLPTFFFLLFHQHSFSILRLISLILSAIGAFCFMYSSKSLLYSSISNF